MRVLLTGSTGRLGSAFLSLWQNDADLDVRVLTRQEADLAQPDEIARFLREAEFDVLVNPAAMSGLEQCLDAPDEARAVNVDSPKIMAQMCREKGARFVHFSTDYVFGGHEEGRKIETDPASAVNVYGRTKLAGEQAVLDANAEALVCRVSWLFGPASPERPSHFEHVLTRALSGEIQHLIADKYSVPTYTHDIVGWVRILLSNKSSGIYHLCNTGEPESWFSYAEKICTLAQGCGYELGDYQLVRSALDEAHFFRDRRPVFTAMLPGRLESEGLATPRHWLEAAEVYLKIR